VAADHQYKNAKALKVANAAELIEDKNLKDELLPVVNEMMLNVARYEIMKKILQLCKTDGSKNNRRKSNPFGGDNLRNTAMMMKTIKNIHFVGIGGIGMSGIAEILLSQGFKISGPTC